MRFANSRCHWQLTLVATVLLTVVALGVAQAKRGAAALGPAPTLTHDLDQLLGAPGAAQGAWGVYVYSLDRQRVLYSHGGDRLFVPASNTKLFTLAAAMELLGPGFRFHTAVTAAAAPAAGGVVEGDVTIAGVGDPSLSGRDYPYRFDAHPAMPPYAADASMRHLASALAASGITRITGGVIGDDSYFPQEPYPPGWAIDDAAWGYGAPVSALTVNDSERFLVVAPGAADGAPATLELLGDADGEAPPIDQVSTSYGVVHIQIDREPGSGRLRVRGGIAVGAPPMLETVAALDPALYAARQLRAALIASGIEVEGAASARHEVTPAGAAAPVELAALDSPPLAQIAQVTAKISQNLEAELLLRCLGKHAAPGSRDDGSRLSGLAVEDKFLHDAGLGAHDTALVDGSGLSRLDLATPAGIVRLLRYMAARPEAEAWKATLPVAARDGSLSARFADTPAAGNLAAKTGTLTHVMCLSGYVQSATGEHLVFSIMANNATPADAARAVLDRIAARLAGKT